MRIDGVLNIIWAVSASGVPADMDFTLATAAKPVTVPPEARSVADALLVQGGGR